MFVLRYISFPTFEVRKYSCLRPCDQEIEAEAKTTQVYVIEENYLEEIMEIYYVVDDKNLLMCETQSHHVH